MISVIVPIYNTEKYLKRCLNSIINQTYNDLEIILVDDGSTDNSLAICKEYQEKDNRIKVFNQVNQGQGVARNLGLDMCNGEYISFIDSDDYIKNDMYEKMLSKMKEYKADIAICGYARDHGILIKDTEVPKLNTTYNNLDLIKAYISTPYIAASVWNKLYKKELWQNYRFPEIRAREDAIILNDILSNVNKAIHIGESLYIQYIRPGSTERKKFSRDKLNSIQASQNMTTYIMNNYPELNKYIFLNDAKVYSDLMKEIISSFTYKQYNKEYNELLILLKSELEKNYELRNLDIKLYNKLNNIFENQFKFIVYGIISGFANSFLDTIKNIVFQVNNKVGN